jgi:hypothetical protein
VRVISAHVAALALYASLVLIGGLMAAPLWIAYGRRCTLDEIEAYHRRRLRDERRGR